MSTGRHGGGAGSTGKNVVGGGGVGKDDLAIEDIKIVNGDLIIKKRSGEEVNLGKTSDRAQEIITHSITIPVGNGEKELTHNLDTKSVMYQVFDSNDEAVEVPSIRYQNKIKFFFGDTDTEATYTVVLAN